MVGKRLFSPDKHPKGRSLFQRCGSELLWAALFFVLHFKRREVADGVVALRFAEIGDQCRVERKAFVQSPFDVEAAAQRARVGVLGRINRHGRTLHGGGEIGRERQAQGADPARAGPEDRPIAARRRRHWGPPDSRS